MEFKKYTKNDFKFLTFSEDFEREANRKLRRASLLKEKAKETNNIKKKMMILSEAKEIEESGATLKNTAEFLKEMENSEI